MINDEMTWQCINQGFCSFKHKIKQPETTFCRNEYNSTGLCNRVSCPLANSEYATVMEKEGVCFLYIKTVERAHTPKHMWEKVKLSKNFMEALKQIDEHLLHWADHKKNRCKQRLTKMRQSLVRQRNIQLNSANATKMVSIKKKTERRETVRAEKAETAAKLELSIEQELLERLRQGTYGDLYNFDKEKFDKMLDEDAEQDEEMEADSDVENLMEMEDEDERNVEYVEGLGDLSEGGSDDSDDETGDGSISEDELAALEKDAAGADNDIEDMGNLFSDMKKRQRGGKDKDGKAKKRKKGPTVEIEYEMEEEGQREKALAK